MLTRRSFAAAAVAAPRVRRSRPNLLFLIADDHAGYVMGCDGNRQAQTPALDALAAAGTRFASHYCNSPVCTPSRQSLLTGQLPHAAGVTRLPTALGADKPTLARQLKRAGYATAVFGKMHFNRAAAAGLHGFDVMLTEQEANRAWQQQVKPTPVPAGVETQTLPWRPFQTPARQWLNAAAAPYPRRDEEMLGSYIARQAMEYMEQNRTKPFALWVSLMEPHSPFNFPLEDRGRFDPRRFAAPAPGPEDAEQIPLIFRDLSETDKQGILAAYYTSAAFLDRNMGRVLEKLAALGLEEDTLVVYTADHGYSLGQHGRFEKHCGYDPALRVPLILRWPGRIRRETVRHMTEHVDLAQTLLELLGAPQFAVRHGRSLWEKRDLVFSEYLENEEVYVRTERWKLIYGTGRRKRGDGYETADPTPGRTVRLFDLAADPDELTNVAAKHPGTVAELQDAALARLRATHAEAAREPSQFSLETSLDFYLRPRDV